jgi:lipopolysaccharide export system protein LptA
LGGWAILPADAKTKGDKDRINISAAKLDYYDKEQKLIYSGNVVAVRGDATLKTPLLVIFLDPKQPGAHSGPPSSTSQMRRMEASGPVTLISKDQIATGDSGIYEKAANKVYIDGNVSLTQGPNVTKGDHIVYDVNTHQAVVTGHVRSMFLPNSETEDEGKTQSRKEAGAGQPGTQ